MPAATTEGEFKSLVSDQAVDEIQMEQYYQRFFPFRYFYQWLNHSPAPSNDFGHREIAFTLSNDKYVRYQSYNSAEAFKKDVLRLIPSRFEVGPVYTVNPRDRKLVSKASFKPVSKELVFDIDLTDYDPVRTCCQDKKICNKCWSFITIAIEIMDGALRDDFGFEHILWVYSGRRGAHAWVCDARARKLDDQKRRAVATYLQVLGKGVRGKAVNLKRPFHPHVQRSFHLLNGEFQKRVLEDQDPWRMPDAAEELLKRLPSALAPALRKKWGTGSVPSRQRWRDVDDVVRDGSVTEVAASTLLEAKQDIIFEYLYPRLDIEVSKHLNHLLKSPFCVHPSTGRVCVPIDPQRTGEFDPLGVPTVQVLLDELNEYTILHKDSPDGSQERTHDYDKTSLKEYVDIFADFVNNLLKAEQRTKRSRDDASLDF